MKTITIPEELNLETSQSVQLYDYQSTQEVSRQQIVLSQNIISFLIEGQKEVFSDNLSLSIDNSKFLIMKSGHCLMTEKLSKVKNYQSILLFFSNESLLNLVRKHELRNPKRIETKSVYSFDYDDFVRRFVNSLIDISKLPKNTQKKLLELKFEEIIIYLKETSQTNFIFSLLTNSDSHSQKFTQIIESNQLTKLTLAELAFLCNMSISTFKREFKKHYAESPIKWFQAKRLEYAHYLLQHEQKNSSEIYLEIGYETLSSFVQAYKSKYNITPKQHQKK